MKKALYALAESMHRSDPQASFSFRTWDGDIIQYGENPKVTFHIRSEEAARHLFADGFLGFGEDYVSERLEVEGDLQELLRLGLNARFDDGPDSLRRRARMFLAYLLTRGSSASQSRKNVAHHYDLNQDFFSLFLDESLAYSCAYFRTENDSLENAQRNKWDRIARKLMLKSGDRLLDIGCGWGGMLFHAALKYGAKCKGITLSRNQIDFVKRRIGELRLEGRAEVSMEDYRQTTGRFDKFVSVGMFEHVGKSFIPVYLEKVAGLLKKGGIGLLHTISKDVDGSTDEWMTKYIFPGGYVPSLPEIVREMGRLGFCILDIENLRPHYGRTLDYWIQNFEKNREAVRKMFDDRFVRMWRLYLNASSAGFKYNGMRVYQILFSNGLNNGLPAVRDYMYADNG
ncbi:MAG: cyclopropane-fatty-acyl-phospholipid synthase family protein [Desulfobacteraceae bacterium]|nr:cyclopropane-fatty-acyl-phospholipid synthase family protein [Desulfobacteraceae bacterium]